MTEETIIWSEKYRPKTFSDIIGQEHIIEKLTAFVEKKNLPHLLFAGSPGVGKSTTALIIARTLYRDTWKENFLELNASDERGIDVVRIKVKDFARTKALGNVPFKIIFLDECDALTKDAQQALRRTMENYTNTCRFILACNYSSKIIDPIQSRCAVFRFKQLTPENIKQHIISVTEKEKINLAEGASDALIRSANGDCRRLVNLLQSAASVNTTLTPDIIHTLSSTTSTADIKIIFTHLTNQQFHEARKKLHEILITNGLSGTDFIKQLLNDIWTLPINERTKVQLIDKAGEIEFRMVEGSDEFLQLEALLAHIMLTLSKEKIEKKEL